MPVTIDINQFLTLRESHPFIDVRTPAEFQQGHIPGAINLPLFSDEERKIVGTIYKQQGKEQAILKGLELVGPKMKGFIEQAIRINTTGTFMVHCWRGGMRSGSIAWLLELYGFKVFTLKGGYKTFRRYVLAAFNKPLKVLIIGGSTGSGKTDILKSLKQKNQQVIDLEGLTNHKGSSFGALGEVQQPTQEQFENNLALEISNLDENAITWIEDESRTVGSRFVPGGLWENMRTAPIIYLDIPFEKRVDYLTAVYGKYGKEDLKQATERIAKRLGPEQTKNALLALEQNNLKELCAICLTYYDKAYKHGLEKRAIQPIHQLPFNELNADTIAQQLISIMQ